MASGEGGTFAGRAGDTDNIKIFAFEFLEPVDFFKLEAGKKAEVDKNHKRKR